MQTTAIPIEMESLRGVCGWLLYFVIGCFLSVVVNIGFAATPGNQPAIIVLAR
ncbi:MAG: hypothetical protein ONB44_03430 [candidate division KSB1 bacterium]|nr:hypothetical protein [candidate division KSB1 bacterium]MDZ7301179.1 hypothetical protein [candidate division KSB1 bacterium]MDZ7310597.1 hypothetical protein [candidate division KSB1 bacterium]